MTSRFPSDISGQSFLVVLFSLLVMSIAMAGVVAMVTSSDGVSKETETQTRLDLWKKGIQNYALHHGGALPANLDALLAAAGACSVTTTGALSGDCGPYVDVTLYSTAELKNDAWGSALSYDSAARTLKSRGADRTLGTTDDWQVSF